jgi:hypothetical protein
MRGWVTAAAAIRFGQLLFVGEDAIGDIDDIEERFFVLLKSAAAVLSIVVSCKQQRQQELCFCLVAGGLATGCLSQVVSVEIIRGHRPLQG